MTALTSSADALPVVNASAGNGTAFLLYAQGGEQHTHLTGAHELSQEQLNAANGDSETELLQRPEHWLGEETSRSE